MRSHRGGVSLEESFERFVVEASPRLLRVAFLLTGDRGEAEDLLQAGFVRLLGRWRNVSDAPDGYALQVLVNLSRDRRRRLGRRPREVPHDQLVEFASYDEVDRFVERDALTQVVGFLPRRQREVVALRFFLDLSITETAAALQCSEGAVKGYTARAMDRLRELLEADSPTATDQRSGGFRAQ